MSEQRVCRYCGTRLPKNRKKSMCAKCAAKKKLIRKLIEVGEPLRVASYQRKIGVLPNDR